MVAANFAGVSSCFNRAVSKVPNTLFPCSTFLLQAKQIKRNERNRSCQSFYDTRLENKA